MSQPADKPRPPKYLENSLLVVASVVPLAVLSYQLPRWAGGLDPTYIRPHALAHSSFPALLKLAAIHPVVWICVLAAIFIRICWNYGWKLER